MVSKKGFQVALFKLAARFQFLNWLFFSIIVFGIVSWTTKFPLNLKSSPWFYIPMASIWLLSFFAWILVWGWYSVWFRYLAYGLAWVISGIRRLLSSTIIQIIIILGLSAKFWIWRKSLYFPKKTSVFSLEINFWKEVLNLDSLLKILVVAAAFFTILKLFQSRKQIVICDFENFTGKKELDPVIKGIAYVCSNEMGRLWKLLKTYNDIHPDEKKDMGKMALNLDVQEIGNDFEQIIGPDSNLKLGNVVTIPIRALYGFFRKILHGPMLTGGVHLKGDKYILTASLKGGKLKGNWNISFEDNDIVPKCDQEKLDKLTQHLVCRILTDLSQGITPRWRAMYHFTEGLRYFRETLLTEEKRKWNYIKAKEAFSQAIRDDEKFVQCYYNFGYIYRKLESNEAAKAAFREALKKKPDYHLCYYQLAQVYYENYLEEKEREKYNCLKEHKLLDAQWFCEQAIAICPTFPHYWNLLSLILYQKNLDKRGEKEDFLTYFIRDKKIPDKVIYFSKIGTMLMWRKLCKSIIKGEEIQASKRNAMVGTRNLAAITAQKRRWTTRFYFGQAFFLAPDNNDLHFEAGKYYYRMNDMPNAYKAFKHVFEDDAEVNDPFLYWALYMNVNAQLYEEEKKKGNRKDKKKEYRDVVNNGYIHFLDAAASEIHEFKSCKDERLQLNEELVAEAYSKIRNNNGKQKKQLFNLSEYLFKLKIDKDFYEWIEEKYKEISWPFWTDIHKAIKSALLILEAEYKGAFNEIIFKKEKKELPIKYAEDLLLKHAIQRLEKKYPNEIKILGLYKHLAEVYLLSGSYEEALKYARKAAKLSPYEPNVREILGIVHFEMKDYNQAIKELQTCFHLGKTSLHILEKIGDAYIKEGKLLHDPDKRKESFGKAIKLFNECHDIIEDKSYEPNAQGYSLYSEPLGKTHFNLAYFYRELLNYDDAISHYQSALEMAKAQKKAFDKFSESPKCSCGEELKKELKNESNALILKIMLEMGWVYMEVQSFGEAEKSFKEAEGYQDASPLAKTEITIGLMFSQVERSLFIDRNSRIFKDWTEITENFIEEKANEESEIIDRLTLNQSQKKERIEELKDKKPRLLSLYHECLGRFYFKQGKMDDAEKEFETSIFFMPNPRVYLYLAEFYLNEASESRMGRKPLLLAKARNACKLCRKNDLRQQYENELADLEKKLDAPGK